jgi:pilus assembly protein CpaB
MKQKNLILIAVAVGCGLVAAFLTTQLGAGQKKVDDSIEVPVAAKDLPVGTKMNKDDLKTFVTYKKISKDALPTEFASSEEQLADKRLVRTIRAGETFNPQDLTTNAPINPPPGFNVMTFGLTPEKGVAGFAGPGSKVDVLATIKLRKSEKAVVMPIAIDMLVLAIDANTQYSREGAFPNLSMVSLAVNNKHASILHAAISRGADIRLILRNADKPPIYDHIPTEEEIWAALADENKSGGREGGPSEGPTEPKGPATVKLPVPVEDLKAGTRLTSDVIQQKFKLVDVVAPAPTKYVQNLKEYTGFYLQRDVLADQYIATSFLGEKPPEHGKPGPAEGPSSKEAPAQEPVKPAKPPEDPPVYFDTTVTGPNGVKKYRYQVLKDGTYKFLGELKGDGSLDPKSVPDNDALPTPAPGNKKKADRVIRS